MMEIKTLNITDSESPGESVELVQNEQMFFPSHLMQWVGNND